MPTVKTNPTKAWLRAFRLRTLPLALACIGMGAFLAAGPQAFRMDISLVCIVTTVSLQILTSVANDYGDSVHGADNVHTKGPARAVQSGAIAPAQMRKAL